MANDTRSRRRWARAAAVAVLGTAVALAFRYADSRGLFTGPAPPLEKLSIALPGVPHVALLYIAAEKGYFTDEGLAVTVIPVIYGPQALALVAQGGADLASTSEVPFVIPVLKGERLGIAATVASTFNDMAVIARRDRAITAPRDLVGKRVGVTFGTSGEYFLWAFMTRHKLAPDSITLVNVPPGQMAQDLASGTIDAASTWDPFKTKAISALADNALSFTDADAYTVAQVVVGRSELLKARSGAIEKLLRALLKAERFNHSEPQQAMALIAGRLKVDVKTLEPGWKDYSFKVHLHQSLLHTLEDEARWAMARGYVDKGPVPNFLPHLHLDALLAAQPERVTVVR